MGADLPNPINPTTTNHIPKWQRVEAILAAGSKPLVKRAWVTSTEWAQIAQEVGAYDPVDPKLPMAKPNPANFNRLQIGKCLLVLNSGHEDQDVVDLMNIDEMGSDKAIFDFKKANYQTGKNS